MGKKQVRAQMRQVKRKPPTPGQLTQGTTRKQRERYVEAGGMLQGYAPGFVIRLGYIAGGVAVACLIVMAVLVLVLRPIFGWGGAIVAAGGPVGCGASRCRSPSSSATTSWRRSR